MPSLENNDKILSVHATPNFKAARPQSGRLDHNHSMSKVFQQQAAQLKEKQEIRMRQAMANSLLNNSRLSHLNQKTSSAKEMQ
jgi:hypothetical protein